MRTIHQANLTPGDIFGQTGGQIRTNWIGAHIPKSERLLFDFTKRFVDLLGEYDIPPTDIAAAFEGFERGKSGDRLTRAQRAGDALRAAVQLTDDAEFSLRLGQSVKLTEFGSFGFAVMSCDTLKDVLGLLARYHPLVDMGPQWRVTRGRSHTMVTTLAPGLSADVRQPLMETVFASLAEAGRELLGKPVTEIRFQASFPPPAHKDAYQTYLYAPITFGHAQNELILPNWLMDLSIRTANPAGHVIFRQQCEDMLRSLNGRENTSAAVRRLIVQAGRNGLDIGWVAAELACSERTLRRRLTVEGTSFRMICDEVRNVLAQNYLSTTQLTVADISDLLDYTEAASFRRAFKRWNGVTPQLFRDRSGGAQDLRDDEG